MERDIAIIEEQAIKVIPLVHTKVPIDDFDDVMQEIKISFWQAFQKFRGESTLETYAFSIAKRTIINYFRERYRNARIKKAHIDPTILAAPESIEKSEAEIDWMTPSEKAVFRLIGQGMSNDKIASALFRSKDTIRSHIKSIYKKLEIQDRINLALLSSKIFNHKEIR